MKLFGKKTLSVDEILAAIEALSDDEKSRLEWALGGADEPTEESSEETPQTEEQSEEAPAEEAPAEEAPADAEGEEVPAPTESDEAEEEAPVAEEQSPEEQSEDGTDAITALRADIEALKTTVESLAARITADAENKPKGTEPFGLAADANGHEAPEKSDLEKAREKYWNF